MRLFHLFVLFWGTLGAYVPATAQPWLPETGMPIGVYYYPEHWPEAQWGRDIQRMAELGFSFTHFAEFAWSRLEPVEGQYDFAWLDSCVTMAAEAGLKVIMCTPSPTPPAWLTEKHPEILVVAQDGRSQQHGTRLHAAYNHPAYQHYVEKIVTRMAERYGQDARIWGWQLDNEPHYSSLYDYSPWQEKQFRHWLRQRYGQIDSLNRAWGTAFWSQDYNHFDQIHLPNPDRGANPHALVDFRRFSAEEVAAGLAFQARVLRRHISDQQWITTNFAYYKFLPSVDPFLSREDLDFASHTMYLTSQFLDDAGDALSHRLGSGLELSFSQDLARSVDGETGIMELQPGQINWGRFNPQPLPGAVRMWLWHAYGLGDRFACAYRFRQPLFGGEQTHYGIMMTDGVTVQRGGTEYMQAIEEIGGLPPRPAAQMPLAHAGRRTALWWDQTSMLDMEVHPHHAGWNSWSVLYTYYSSLKRLGAPVDLVIAGDQLDPKVHPFLVVPAAIRVDAGTLAAWRAYAEAGGHLILTARTGTKDAHGHLWEARQQEPIWDLIGAEIEYFDHLPAEHPGQIRLGEASYPWHIWGDVLRPQAGTEVLATHADQFYAGAAAATTRRLGKGSVSYLGLVSDGGELEYQLLRGRFLAAGAEVMDLPPYVFVNWRSGYWVAVNYTAEAYDLPLSRGANLLHGDRVLPPAGVTVWTADR
ncbi:MAG: beta-galactosidase [Bacteroidetes bacterium]|nr:MAG: beta-galactosidase [Bacteroidota bacterium]